MNVIKAKYLVKCEIPGCENIAKQAFSAGADDSCKIAICDKCVKTMYNKLKIKNE